ncbi:MAG TPA: RNA polymerase factor sigma-54 [Thermoanaerobaculia bacterium]|nr:RNA polymerase factor sigma-54 [Thermoanaerobaculia bacterium]
MALEQKLSLRLSQRLVMTPSLQQAIKLLQMTRLELEGVLSQELEENPVLETSSEPEDTEEEGQESPAEPEAPAEPAEESAMDEIDFEAYFDEYLDSPEYAPSMTTEMREAVPIENTLTEEPDLYDHLRWQLQMMELSPRLCEIAESIIGNLNEDGFLVASLEEIQLLGAEPGEAEAYRRARAIFDESLRANGSPPSADRAALTADAPPVPGYERGEVEQALEIVRGFDPPGIACRDLRESLMSQLAARGERETLAYRLVAEDWERVLRRQFPQIAKDYGVPLAELEDPVGVIRTLETRPGRRYGGQRTQYVEPDVSVVRVGDQYVIQLNDDGLPRLRVSRAYRQMLREMRREGRQAEAQQFLKDKMRSAVWLIKSLDQRQRTIYKVADSIVRQQGGFLDRGIEHLRPMVLRDVAEDIGMHESTVSRVVSNKYIHTPRGLFPMKFFFHSGIDRDQGEDISSLTVKRRLKQMIQEEEPKRPLSDSELMRRLNEQGIHIARRTVAKYRDELGIPSSTDRKQVF